MSAGGPDDLGPAADPSDALSVLARELYWAGDPLTRRATDTGSIRERLHSFAHRLRVEGRELYPSSEAGLDRAPRLRRRAKRALWHGSRFATFRYDRLLAELAELNAQLAERADERFGVHLGSPPRERRLRVEDRDPHERSRRRSSTSVRNLEISVSAATRRSARPAFSSASSARRRS